MEEQKIQEAEFEIPTSSEKKEEQKKRTDFYIELALFLILGILIGIALKTEAMKRITIGFDDYKMKIYSSSYNLNKMQKEQIQKMSEEQAQTQNNQNQESN